MRKNSTESEIIHKESDRIRENPRKYEILENSKEYKKPRVDSRDSFKLHSSKKKTTGFRDYFKLI